MRIIFIGVLSVVLFMTALTGCGTEKETTSGTYGTYQIIHGDSNESTTSHTTTTTTTTTSHTTTTTTTTTTLGATGTSTTANRVIGNSVPNYDFEDPKVGEGKYVEISSANELREIEDDPEGHYVLVNDIDLTEYERWSPLCSTSNPFTGILDGNGYCIRNINVDVTYSESNADSAYAGLFCCISGATIKNLGMVGGTVCINSDTHMGTAGAFAGMCQEYGRDKLPEIMNCWANLTVKSNRIENGSTSYVATMAIGAFVGEGNVNFTNCYNLGEVAASGGYADQILGGFIGRVCAREWCPMTIKSCYNYGLMSGRHISGDKPGGFVGDSVYDSVDIIDSYYGTDANDMNRVKIAMTDRKDKEFTSVKGLTVEELTVQSNFEGFDFANVWAISADRNEGLPYLRVQRTIG